MIGRLTVRPFFLRSKLFPPSLYRLGKGNTDLAVCAHKAFQFCEFRLNRTSTSPPFSYLPDLHPQTKVGGDRTRESPEPLLTFSAISTQPFQALTLPCAAQRHSSTNHKAARNAQRPRGRGSPIITHGLAVTSVLADLRALTKTVIKGNKVRLISPPAFAVKDEKDVIYKNHVTVPPCTFSAGHI